MAKFSYHPPTRKHCTVCEKLIGNKESPIIDKLNGKASSASKFPVHNWYYFVLGYSPDFSDYILKRENITDKDFVVDPFMGSGTTLISCKNKGISSIGIDANDYFLDVAKTKTNWKIKKSKVKNYQNMIVKSTREKYLNYTSTNNKNIQEDFFSKNTKSWEEYAERHRMNMMTDRYISDIPFAKLVMLKKQVDAIVIEKDYKDVFNLAISSIIVPVSNVRYGPGFGVSKPKFDINVLDIFIDKVNRMISDLKFNEFQINTSSKCIHGDSRELSKYFDSESVDLMITSPPYPGDHEYTKHTRLELIFMGYASNIQEFRTIKKRMIRGSTTNIYKDDIDRKYVEHFNSIHEITSLIDERLKADNATSGFEKLYVRLVWEYFGGMYRTLKEAKKVLKKGGKIVLLVSDSHAFKMVHIQTAKILSEIGLDIGYKNSKIELWQDKVSTSHKYHLRENIITLTK